MITNDQELALVREQAARMECIIESLAKTVRPRNERNYQIFIEGPADQLASLRHEIDDYLGNNRRSR